MLSNHIHRYFSLAAIFALLVLATGCKKDDPEPDTYTIPTTYSFDNVSYSGQTDRQNMLEEMTTLMKTGNTSGTVVNAQTLKDMYRNENNPFSFTSAKQLKNKTFPIDQNEFETYMDNLAAASQSTVAGSNGTAGVVVSPNDASKKYLCDANGVEWTQLIEKGMMGSIFYYQITSVYLSDDKIGPAVDNATITPGEGTDMEHHWDEAFGYFGVPTDFPTNTVGVRFIGKYCNGRDGALGLNSLIMNAYLKGRAAISNDDMTTKNEQIPILRDNLELVFAGTVIHYLNEAKASLADDAVRNHVLSEAVAFLIGLRCNPTKKISQSNINAAMNAIGTNFYEVTLSGLNSAIDIISTTYNLDNVKDQL